MAAGTNRLGSRGNMGAVFARYPWLRETVLYGGNALMGLAMGAGRLFSGCGPYGVALVAAAGTELEGIFCLLGASAGYLLCGGLYPGIRYIAAAFLVYTVAFTTRWLKWREREWFMPAVTVAALGLTGGLFYQELMSGMPGLMRIFLEMVLGGSCAYFFAGALSGEEVTTEAGETRRGICAAVMCACLLLGAARIKVLGVISLGRVGALVVVMAAGFCGGALPGSVAGTALGFGMDMAGGGTLFYAAAYAMAGLVAGLLHRYGRLAFGVCFCAANAVAVLLGHSGGLRVEALYECFGAAVVFILLPQSVLTPVGSLLRVGRGRGETAFRLYQANRLHHLAEGFQRLYDCASRETVPPEQDPSAIFDRAADAVCRVCGGKERCWKMAGAETVQDLSATVEAMTRKGALTVKELPPAFRQRCVAPEAFVSAVNGELRGYMYRKQYAARLREGRAAAYGQFLDMAEVMTMAARELGECAGPDGAAERRLIRLLKCREMDGVCSVFRDGRGRLHAVIEGPEIEAFAEQPDYLEALSEAVGVRLCRVKREAKGRLVLRQAEPLAVSVGIAALKKEGEAVSGDRGTYFKTDSGLLCVILSDGMGTGEKAARESVAAVEILEELLKAGMDPGCAMRLLNSASMLKNGEDWGYATVDLCCVDLFTGETGFYKYGAAPSYVKTGRGIRRVKCASLAAGMLAGEGSQPDVTRMRLRPGYVALIASDGVLAERKDQWLRDLLAASDGTDTRALAAAALKAASSRFGNADDMTVLAIRVEERL